MAKPSRMSARKNIASKPLTSKRKPQTRTSLATNPKSKPMSRRHNVPKYVKRRREAEAAAQAASQEQPVKAGDDQRQTEPEEETVDKDASAPVSSVLRGPLEDGRVAAAACLRWMLAPVETSTFFDQNWERRPLLISRNGVSHYSAVFSTGELDRILRQELIQYGRNLDVTSYSGGQRETHNPTGRALAPVVWDYYRNGCSLRLLNPQTYSTAVWRICSTLQEYFGCLVGANVYLTPPGTQGFAPHFDDIEAFMLQLEGSKEWRVYKPRPGEEMARDSSPNFTADDLTDPPLIETVLQPGDLLYMPRGCIHQGRALPGQHSLHITLSCYQKTCWADLLEKMVPVALQRAAEDCVDYRRGLPIGYLNHVGLVHDGVQSTQRTRFVSEARRLVTRLLDYLPIDAAADQMGKQFMHDALPPSLSQDEKLRTVQEDGERWRQGRIHGMAVMDEATQVKLVRSSAVRLVSESGELRLYYCVENARVYQEVPEQYLELASEQQADAIGTLVRAYPEYTPVHRLLPGLPPDEQVAFVSSLWEKGLLITKAPLLE